MEWCIDKDGKPYFVQARPITSTVFINKATKNDGIVASRGYAEGETYVIDENKSDEEIKYALRNNYCRCTGYVKIIDAVRIAAKVMQEGTLPEEINNDWHIGSRVARIKMRLVCFQQVLN